jgi:hypothetical protein
MIVHRIDSRLAALALMLVSCGGATREVTGEDLFPEACTLVQGLEIHDRARVALRAAQRARVDVSPLGGDRPSGGDLVAIARANGPVVGALLELWNEVCGIENPEPLAAELDAWIDRALAELRVQPDVSDATRAELAELELRIERAVGEARSMNRLAMPSECERNRLSAAYALRPQILDLELRIADLTGDRASVETELADARRALAHARAAMRALLLNSAADRGALLDVQREMLEGCVDPVRAPPEAWLAD